MSPRSGAHVAPLSFQLIHRAPDSLVLLHLVLRRAGALFRPGAEGVADLFGFKRNYWARPLYQHRGGWSRTGQTRVLANVPVVSDSLLCLQIRGFGERQGIRPRLLTEAGGTPQCARPLRWLGAPGQRAETHADSGSPSPLSGGRAGMRM